MTTVAYRNGILASDSKMTAGGTYVGNYKKIFKITLVKPLPLWRRVIRQEPESMELLVGCCGIVSDIQDYLDFLFHGGELPDREMNCLIITIDEQKEIMLYDNGNESGISINSDYYAMGSGSDVAFGALYAGASAVDAVKASIHHDNHSGGEVQTVSFD